MFYYPRDKGLEAGFDAQTVLDALDGLAYMTSTDGTILAVGQPNWNASAEQAQARRIRGPDVIGKSLLDYVSGSDVRELQRALHDQIVSRSRPQIIFDFRCDDAVTERRTRMSITPVLCNSAVIAVLYHSIVLDQFVRPRIGLFEHYNRVPDTYPDSDVLKVCSYCHDVAWPVPGQQGAILWIEPDDYYRRGGTSDVLVSHGICPVCYDRVLPSRQR